MTRPATQPRSADHRRLGAWPLVVGLSLGATGCNGTLSSDQRPVAPSETTVTTSRTAAPPETTIVPATTTTMAIPDTTGTDLVNVVQNLDLTLSLAYERTDLSLLDIVYLPDSPSRKVIEQQLRTLQEKGLHYAEGPERPKLTDFTVQTPEEGVAIVEVTSSRGRQVVQDAAGQVVQTNDGWAPRRERYGLVRGSDGRWRIRDAYIVGPA